MRESAAEGWVAAAGWSCVPGGGEIEGDLLLLSGARGCVPVCVESQMFCCCCCCPAVRE